MSDQTVRTYRFDDPDEAFRIARRRILNNALRRDQRSLDLSGYGLAELPPEIGKLKNLSVLHLQGNKLTSIPDFIGDLTALVEIFLSHNSISTITARISGLKNLRKIDLEDNDIENLPESFSRLRDIQTLDLGYNRILSIPACIFELPSLVDLVLQKNSIKEIPSGIGNLKNLRRLDLDDNELSGLPPEIGLLNNLEELHFAENNIRLLPNEFGRLKSLKWLDGSKNGLRTLPTTFGDLEHLTDLDLSENALTAIPITIGRLSALEDLNLASNALVSIPDEIGSLKALTSLDISDNNIDALPPTIGSLSSLSNLAASHNSISSFSPELAKLDSLDRLDLSENTIGSIPPEIAQLTSLRSLHLQNNNLTTIPAQIEPLWYLQDINLENNKLTELPREFGRLRALERAALNYNRRTRRSAGGLWLRGNPLKEPYPALISMGQPSATINVLAWLRGELDPGSIRPAEQVEESHSSQGDGPAQPELETGPSFQLVGGMFDLTDHAHPKLAKGEIVQQTLHKRLLRQLEALKLEADRFANSYPELAATIFEYDNFANRDFEKIDVVNLWATGNALIAHTVALDKSNQTSASAPPLEPHQRALLIETTRLHGGFILGFPEGLELTERADRTLSSQDIIRQIEHPTSVVLNTLSKQEAFVSIDARNFAETLQSALHAAGWTATRAGYSAYATVRNFLIEVGQTLVLFDEKGGTVTGGALLSAAISASGITPHTLELLLMFFQSNAASILAFAAPFPEMRTWVQWIIDHLDGEHSANKQPRQ